MSTDFDAHMISIIVSARQVGYNQVVIFRSTLYAIHSKELIHDHIPK